MQNTRYFRDFGVLYPVSVLENLRYKYLSFIGLKQGIKKSSHKGLDYREQKNGRGSEIRTRDFLLPKQARYQLRYAPFKQNGTIFHLHSFYKSGIIFFP